MYFEEFEIGQKFYTEPITITLKDIKEFAEKYDPLKLHTDDEFAKDSIFKSTISSGFYTLCVVWGQWVKLNIIGDETIAGLGIDNLKWLLPVYPDDTLTGELEISHLKPTSKGGLLVVNLMIYNQNNKSVLTAQVKQLVKSKNLKNFRDEG